MVKEAVEIAVIKRDILFKKGELEGFVPIHTRNYLPTIENNYEYQLRDYNLEVNKSFKQIIPYLIIINPKKKTVFGYKRFKKAPGLHEVRLHDKFSIGLGGHIDKSEVEEDLIMECMMREFKEEVKMDNYPSPKYIGFVNCSNTEVDGVHFAIVAVAETYENIEKREGDEVTEEKFYSIKEIDDLMQNKNIEMDSWTRLCWPEIKQLLN